MMETYFQGLVDPLRGLKLVFSRGDLRKLAVLPTLITGLIFLVVIAAFFFFSDDLMGLIWEQPAGIWGNLLWWPVYILLLLIVGVVVLVGALMLGTPISAPFLTRIARRVREILEDRKLPPAPGGLYADVFYPIWLELRLFALFIFFHIACFLAQFVIFGSSIVLVPVQFFISAFLLALGFLDYAMESDALPGFMGRLQYGHHHLARTLGFGSTLCLMLSIPVINLLLLPAAAAGAAIFYVEEAKKKERANAN